MDTASSNLNHPVPLDECSILVSSFSRSTIVEEGVYLFPPRRCQAARAQCRDGIFRLSEIQIQMLRKPVQTPSVSITKRMRFFQNHVANYSNSSWCSRHIH
ncbi:unnamed protein product [Hymenolepis diminuta]|uniref:Uncharacterized protein n=1 Tax=Hymenolepis diminuta TaxID=6216 RepID=A0A564YY98_HYMDI|nr:unnamed protein product [Hymenolepis diminuta]